MNPPAFYRAPIAARRLALVGLLCLFAVGCGGQYPSSVSGQVTLDGSPVTHGTVTFYPVGTGPAAFGQIGANGDYQLRVGEDVGLPPGSYVVTVASKVWPEENADSPTAPQPGSFLTPKRYASRMKSDLRGEVQAGSNTIDLALTTDP